MGTGWAGGVANHQGFGACNASSKEEVGWSGGVGRRREKGRFRWQAFLEDVCKGSMK